MTKIPQMESNNIKSQNTPDQIKPPVLDRRLSMVASLVPDHCIPADIGTDHAFLPSYLVMTGRIKSAIASDIVNGPLQNAINTVSRYGLKDKIRCILSNGTQNLSPEDYNTLIIAGMGGELIRDILSRAEMLEKKTLILQPMTHAEDLRRFLCAEGFETERELAVTENKKIYIAFSASYTGCITHRDDVFFHYFGNYPFYDDIASEQYVRKQIKRLRCRMNGLEHSAAGKDQETETISLILNDKRLEKFL